MPKSRFRLQHNEGTATMRGTAFNAGQMAELNTAMSIAVATAMQKVASKFGDPKAVLKGIRNKGAVLSSRLEPALEQVIRSMLVLVRRGSIHHTILNRFDPRVDYLDSPHLDISDDFRAMVVAKARETTVGTIFHVNVDDIGEDLPEAVIEKTLPKKHYYEESAVCALIDVLTAKQLDDETGDLEHTGKANIFFTEHCVACVSWDSLRRVWMVQAWRRSESIWNAGGRVFSPAH